MSKKAAKKKIAEVTVPIIEDVTIVDTGREFRVRVGGEAYRELMKTELEFPELAGEKRMLAVFALTALATMLSKQLVEALGGVVEDAPTDGEPG